MDFTQHHHWGITEHGIGVEIYNAYVSEYLYWEFTTPEEMLVDTFGLDVVNDFLSNQGGFLLTDTPNMNTQYHYIEIWAFHSDPKMLTWISLNKR